MKRIFFIAILFSLGLMFTSCEALFEWNQPEEPTVEYSAVWPLSGEWWVQYSLEDGTDVSGGYMALHTYNTAAEDVNKLWVSDAAAHFWIYTAKVDCDVPSRTFSGSVASAAIDGDVPYDINITITDGKVLEDGGFSTSGVVCDSIYFKIEFEDDPGTKYVVAGVRRTGFLEDEH